MTTLNVMATASNIVKLTVTKKELNNIIDEGCIEGKNYDKVISLSSKEYPNLEWQVEDWEYVPLYHDNLAVIDVYLVAVVNITLEISEDQFQDLLEQGWMTDAITDKLISKLNQNYGCLDWEIEDWDV